MFKHALFVALLVLCFVLVVSAATPPACFLACVNEEDKVSDYKAVCSSASMQTCLDDRCSIGAIDAALTHYQAACKEVGYTVTIATPTPGAKKSKSPDGAPADDSSSSSTVSGSGATSTDASSGALHSFGITFMSLFATTVGISCMLL